MLPHTGLSCTEPTIFGYAILCFVGFYYGVEQYAELVHVEFVGGIVVATFGQQIR